MNLPPLLRWLWDAWMGFSYVLGRVMSFILLTIFWIIVLGPYAIAWKIQALFSSSSPTDSYWIASEGATADSMKRQF